MLRTTPQLARRDAARGGWSEWTSRSRIAVGLDLFRCKSIVRRERGGRRSTHASRSNEDDTVAGNEHPLRSLLWVDAVGGFLVCLDDCVILGQPSSGDKIAVPILADLSRRHAVIRRDAGAYVLEPLQPTRVDGREVSTPFVLSNNHLIQLGDNVRIRFERPHALSATARLTLESHHKTQPIADAVLLMADSCVLGPNRHCHVRCREWERDVVVFRQEDRIYCRAAEPRLDRRRRAERRMRNSIGHARGRGRVFIHLGNGGGVGQAFSLTFTNFCQAGKPDLRQLDRWAIPQLR